MVMEENDGGDHQKAVVTAVAPPQPASAAVKSVWNIPSPLPDIVDREKSTTGGSTTVMAIHTNYWPALGESQAQAEAKSPPPRATNQPTSAPHQGHRAELYVARVAKCLAALEGREKVVVDDLKKAVKYPSEIP